MSYYGNQYYDYSGQYTQHQEHYLSGPGQGQNHGHPVSSVPPPNWDWTYAQYHIFTESSSSNPPKSYIQISTSSKHRVDHIPLEPRVVNPIIKVNNNNFKPDAKPSTTTTTTNQLTVQTNTYTVKPNVDLSFAGVGGKISVSTDQEYEQKLREHRRGGREYVDYDFPAEEKSLFGNEHPSDKSHWRRYVWKRAREFYQGSFQIFVGGIEPNDIRQGELGDCYFLSTISSLAEFPKRISNLFPVPSDGGNTNGFYAVKMCCRGIWKNIYLDDLFPCNKTSGPVFTTGNGNELWVLLLEKAWAKVHGSYLRIEAGLTRECLHDLTGAPTRVLFNDDKNLWNAICEAEQRNWVMTCGTGGDDLNIPLEQIEEVGLHPDHAYSMLSACEIQDDNGRNVKLVRLRNPWGKGEWNGNWSDKSRKWTSNTSNQVLRKLGQGALGNKDDGIFFMDFEDFKRYYPDIQICQIEDSYEYAAAEGQLDYNHSTIFSIQVVSHGEYYLTVNQDSKRMYPRNGGYEYSQVSMILASNQNGQLNYVIGKTGKDREVWLRAQLSPGTYYLRVKVAWYQRNRRAIGVSCYGPKEARVQELRKGDVNDFLKNCYISKGRLNKSKWKDSNGRGTYSMSEYSDEGILYFYLRNETRSRVCYEINFTELKNLKLAKPHRGYNARVNVDPGCEDIVLLKKTGLGISYNYSIRTN